MTQDEHWMREALAWSARGRGWTSPRPSVGCAIVKDDRLLGGGHTQPGDGNPHAEVCALMAAQNARHDTRGATAYVTLEPCSHFATTPPCTNALVSAGIARVVCGVRDPNEEVDGRGFAQLRAAGVEVVENFLLEECLRAQDDFLFHIARQTPMVTLKIATSLDGSIATHSGESQWITGEAARRRAHELRHQHDAVLVGIGTLLADDPQLSVRLDGDWKQPARIVLDPRGETPLQARLFAPHETATSPDLPRVIIAATEAALPSRLRALQERGATVLRFHSERIAWRELLPKLYDLGVCSVMIEGGGGTIASALKEDAVDKVAWFHAPMLIPGGKRALGDLAPLERLRDAPRLRHVAVERLGDDFFTTGYLHPVPGA